MRKAVFALLFLALGTAASAQNIPTGFDLSNYGVRIEPDKRVMVVLAALDAARTTNEAGETVPVLNTKLSPEGTKFQEILRSDLAALNPDLRQKISTFVIQHKKRYPNATDAEIVAPFISMAYALAPVPELSDPIVTTDLPGTLLDVLDFAPLVRDFYRRSSFSANLNEYVKTYQRASESDLRNSSREMVSDLLNYLHTRPQLYFAEKVKTETRKSGSKTTTLNQTETRQRERKFFIVPEMLAPVGNVIYLNVKDDYAVVVPPETNVTFSEVRRGFLQFVIDPIVLQNSKDIATIRDSVKAILEERRKVDPKISPDVYLTISRSLVAAIDTKQTENLRKNIALQQSRQRIDKAKTPEEKSVISQELRKYQSELADETALQLSEDYDKGAVLVFYFADQLSGVEDSGFDIASSMREMILSFDPAKETGRYASFADARKRALAVREERKKNPVQNVIAVNPVTTRLVEIQKLIDAKDYSQAMAELKKLAAENPVEPRIHYNIGRVASFAAESITDRDQQAVKIREAKTAYENVVKIAQRQPLDPALLSLTYVALAKIYEFFDDNTYAVAVYDAAIRVGNVTGGAYNEAIAAKQRLLKNP
jgi:tetratricopeptide (TPR) repeat protein